MASDFKRVQKGVVGLKVVNNESDVGCSEAAAVQRLTRRILHITVIIALPDLSIGKRGLTIKFHAFLISMTTQDIVLM